MSSARSRPWPSPLRRPVAPWSQPSCEFRASHPRRRSLAADQAAQVLVIVDLPGTVVIPGLGLSASADAVTPARFDVLEHRPGRYPILFAPAGSAEATDAAPRACS